MTNLTFIAVSGHRTTIEGSTEKKEQKCLTLQKGFILQKMLILSNLF